MDRNLSSLLSSQRLLMSLSARRAWIEIIDYIIDYATDAVALRKESVDRNILSKSAMVTSLLSLSARRAWIEMVTVSLYLSCALGRSPQGERG